MGNRLTKIYTRTGDGGDTGLAGGERVPKDGALIHAMGDVDELNSLLGLLACKLSDDLVTNIKTIQNDLFDLGAELAMCHPMITENHVSWLEKKLDVMNEELPALKEFILPGGGEAATLCHLARSVCRRAERQMVTAKRESDIGEQAMAYINRLSDLLFVLARFITQQVGEQEVYWQSTKTVNSE